MDKPILLETSARHVHVSREALNILFGEGYELTKKKDLSQPGQFACEERVAVIGPKGQFRESGDIAGSGACKIVGPKGEIEIDEGVIIAKRHIHMTPEDAKELGVEDKDIVCVEVDSEERSLVFGDVVVRVSEKFSLAMHIDTDESNAAGAVPGMTVHLI